LKKIIVIIISLTCSSIAYSKTLLKEIDLKKLLPGQKMYRADEAFYLLPDGSMLYEERDNGNMKPGLWFLKKATFNYDSPAPYRTYKPTKKELVGETVVCLAIGVTVADEFSWTPCARIYQEEDNLYLTHITECNIGEPLESGVIHCNWQMRTFGYFRLKKIDD